MDQSEATEPEAAGRTCPRPGCTKVMSAGVYACGPHWYELPADIRGSISQAWWSALRGSVGALERHEAATDRAEQWWAATVVSPQGRLL